MNLASPTTPCCSTTGPKLFAAQNYRSAPNAAAFQTGLMVMNVDTPSVKVLSWVGTFETAGSRCLVRRRVSLSRRGLRYAAGAACRLKHDEGAIDVGAEIGLRLLDRRHDVGARRQMEGPFRPCAGGHDGSAVGDVGLDNFQERIIVVLSQIVTPADDEVVEHANAPSARDQPVNEVTANEPSAACYYVTTH
jgi:hypothetical protein